jgi:F420-dependent oxidoreductase-like protein
VSAAALSAAGLDSGWPGRHSAHAQAEQTRKDRRMTRFGIQIEPQFGFSYDEVASLAKDAERLGFDAMWVSDHLFWNAQSEQRNCMDAWTLLTALAPVTTSLRLGTLVSCNSYRLPSVLAKVAASFDHLSNGRLEFGIGAGWKEMEYKAYGIPFPPIGTRLAQLEEAVQLMKMLWTQQRSSFQGKYYRLDRAVCAPKPVQQPLKTWIGGMGEKKLLRMVARYADGWNAMPVVPVEAMRKKMDVLRRHCDAVGRDYATIEKSLFILCCVVDTESELRTRGAELEKALGTSDVIRAGRKIRTAGTPEQVAETLRGFQQLGFDYFIAMFPYQQDAEMLQRFSQQVMPLLR